MTTKTSVRPQALPGRPAGNRPGAAAGGQGAGPSTATAAAQPRRPKLTPLTPMRVQTAKSMSRLASSVRESHPELPAAQHLMDAARTLRAGQHEASQRHLRAAMFSLTPQSLMRNGQHTDDLHIGARSVMHDVHRHLLLVKDLDDVAAKNQAAIARDSYGDDAPSMRQPDPNAGYGPGANAQKPTARQPGGDRALNAPSRADGGGSDPAVADPQLKMSKQFSYGWGDLAAVIELAIADEMRNATGEWTSMGQADKAKALSPAEKKAYVKTGVLPDRYRSVKAHDTASATASRDAKATIARDKAARTAARPAARAAAAKPTRAAPFAAGRDAEAAPAAPSDGSAGFRAAQASGIASDKVPGGAASGVQSDTHIITYKNGSKYVTKDFSHTPTPSDLQKLMIDKELMTAQVSDMIGARAPKVIRTGNSTMAEEAIEGHPLIADAHADMTKIVHSPQGRKIGLLDILTGQADRHNGNVMINKAGEPVPIDHNDSWGAVNMNGTMITNSPFAVALQEDIAAGKSPFSVADLDQIGTKMKAARASLTQNPDAAENYTLTMDRLALLRKQVAQKATLEQVGGGQS
jgi:hypothetical protein